MPVTIFYIDLKARGQINQSSRITTIVYKPKKYSKRLEEKGHFLTVNQKLWILTHWPSTNLQTVLCIVLLDFLFRQYGSHDPTHPFTLFQFSGPNFLMLVQICSWTSQRSYNRWRSVFKHAELIFLNKKYILLKLHISGS